jgi:ribosomal-protein-alanine N-acetyltransferase
MQWSFAPMDESSAREILHWRYEPPYDVYDVGQDVDDPSFFTDPGNGYFAVRDESGDLIAYVCYGADARVPGGNYEGGAIDLGAGLRPDLTGRRLGPGIIEAAMAFGSDLYGPRPFRATVAAFNERSLAACRKVGFVARETFARPSDGLEFVILIREAGGRDDGGG